MCLISKIEPKNVKETLNDEYYINFMYEKLVQFERNEVWVLVPRPNSTNIIGTKLIYKNKSDDNENVTRNKAHLVLKVIRKLKELTLIKHLL